MALFEGVLEFFAELLVGTTSAQKLWHIASNFLGNWNGWTMCGIFCHTSMLSMSASKSWVETCCQAAHSRVWHKKHSGIKNRKMQRKSKSSTRPCMVGRGLQRSPHQQNLWDDLLSKDTSKHAEVFPSERALEDPCPQPLGDEPGWLKPKSSLNYCCVQARLNCTRRRPQPNRRSQHSRKPERIFSRSTQHFSR
mgnify:CR=1 FL=1